MAYDHDRDHTIDDRTPDALAREAVWRRVLQHLPQLERIARGMARGDPRVDAADMLQEAIADIVDAEPRVYDPARGPWLTWARTRVRLAWTYAQRRLIRRGREREVIGGLVSDEDPEVQHAVDSGGYGHHDRTDAAAMVRELEAIATPDERDAMIVLAYGFHPRLVDGRAGLDDRLRSLRRRAVRRWGRVPAVAEADGG